MNTLASQIWTYQETRRRWAKRGKILEFFAIIEVHLFRQTI